MGTRQSTRAVLTRYQRGADAVPTRCGGVLTGFPRGLLGGTEGVLGPREALRDRLQLLTGVLSGSLGVLSGLIASVCACRHAPLQ